MFEESFVFGRKCCLDQVLGNLIECGGLVAEIIFSREMGEFAAVAVKQNAVSGRRFLEFFRKWTEERENGKNKE